MERPTTNSVASVATIAIVTNGNAAITTAVATVVVSSIGVVAIVVATITSIATKSNIASCRTSLDSVSDRIEHRPASASKAAR